ncbi:MAG: pyridoxamine kinase [Ruminiclostridium sp.]|nr:pyridoxamine kinase [Ruminiclostridium sp.]
MSGFGRCSLAVITPVISAMGIQCVPVPTAILSTHTGGFDDFVFRDMTDFISPCCKHYKKLGIDFDTIYSGFLGSDAQVDSCIEFFESFPNAKRVVDPVMGDDGECYKTYTPRLIERMKELVRHADIITPNLTEAALLLDMPYSERLSEARARDMLELLCTMSGSAVITGVKFVTGEHANICMNGQTGEYAVVRWDPLPASYPGTGDIFASVMTGRMMLGDRFEDAVRTASVFVHDAVKATMDNGKPRRNGVEFERVLGTLMM